MRSDNQQQFNLSLHVYGLIEDATSIITLLTVVIWLARTVTHVIMSLLRTIRSRSKVITHVLTREGVTGNGDSQ